MVHIQSRIYSKRLLVSLLVFWSSGQIHSQQHSIRPHTITISLTSPASEMKYLAILAVLCASVLALGTPMMNSWSPLPPPFVFLNPPSRNRSSNQ